MDERALLNLGEWYDAAIGMIVLYAPKFVLALMTLIIGLWLINAFMKRVDHTLMKRFDPTLTGFIRSLASIILKLLLLVSVAGMIGIETTSFIAVLGAAGLAVGLALQGNLSNFASGVIILVFRPFRVGDVIEGAGHIGTVREILMFTTILMTGDNRKIIIPNSSLTTNPVINITSENTRRVDLVFGVSYDDDLDHVRRILTEIIEAEERIHQTPEPTIQVAALVDSAVNFNVRVWCLREDYWGIFYTLTETVKKRFDREGIRIPYPQRDVHLHGPDVQDRAA